ncbi:unnamed protein product [Pieris macdunnoughi]|uniref:Uncharacterized protein n=1 Tax=Pieris macdunnoughi TaxID=345717 RepID=A0A821XHX5_9NEOP|nr:unnamed protein product [Pieris macdunnoughi]
MTQGMVLPTNTDAHMAININGNFSISTEIETYYGISPNNNVWGQSINMPYPCFLQWGSKFDIDMTGSYEATEGVITAAFESPHLLVQHSSNVSISWLATTLDTRTYYGTLKFDVRLYRTLS